MSEVARTNLSQELVELFDIRKAKIRDEKILTQLSNEAQRDIRLLTHMFRDGIPDLEVKISLHESIMWDSNSQKLMYANERSKVLLEGAPREIRIKARPFLTELVKKAKDLYV
ncbi:MAG: hypothetical protein AB7I27_06960 [Bacteriovoracaceae bacterium]